MELKTSFDGYELLRSNDEVEETASFQFISASADRQKGRVYNRRRWHLIGVTSFACTVLCNPRISTARISLYR